MPMGRIAMRPYKAQPTEVSSIQPQCPCAGKATMVARGEVNAPYRRAPQLCQDKLQPSPQPPGQGDRALVPSATIPASQRGSLPRTRTPSSA